MKWFSKIAGAIENGIKLMKFFECVSAGLQAFVDKAKENGLYATGSDTNDPK